jgi:hypothetical protein
MKGSKINLRRDRIVKKFTHRNSFTGSEVGTRSPWAKFSQNNQRRDLQIGLELEKMRKKLEDQ